VWPHFENHVASKDTKDYHGSHRQEAHDHAVLHERLAGFAAPFYPNCSQQADSFRYGQRITSQEKCEGRDRPGPALRGCRQRAGGCSLLRLVLS
jgi:hypothetical protein